VAITEPVFHALQADLSNTPSIAARASCSGGVHRPLAAGPLALARHASLPATLNIHASGVQQASTKAPARLILPSSPIHGSEAVHGGGRSSASAEAAGITASHCSPAVDSCKGAPPFAAVEAATDTFTAAAAAAPLYQPGQIGLPGHTQLVRGASALLTGLVLPERPDYMGANLSRQGSICHPFGTADSSRWDLGNSSMKGLGRAQTQDSIGFMPPSLHGIFSFSTQHNMCAADLNSADYVMPSVGQHLLTTPPTEQAEAAAAHAAVGSSGQQPFSSTTRLSRTRVISGSTVSDVSAWQHAVGSSTSGQAGATAAATRQGPLLIIGPNGGESAVRVG
jgi:hypothetical protein